MAFFIDTSVLDRLANASDVQFPIAQASIAELHRQAEVLHITPQNLVEFRAVATRPVNVNGLGLSTAEAELLAAIFLARFPLLPETPDIYPTWKTIVESLGIIGKQVHDARLVAVCHVHGVSHLLTFNVGHFTRFASCGPGLASVDPATV